MMAKDWEFHKEKLIEEVVQHKLNWFKNIERRGFTPIEMIAFMYLVEYSNGGSFVDFELEVNPQCKLGSYTVDFLVVHVPTNTHFIVECDGHDFHEKTKRQAGHDKKRDRFFTKLGYVMLRYTGSQICENPEEMINDIDEMIAAAIRNKRNIS